LEKAQMLLDSDDRELVTVTQLMSPLSSETYRSASEVENRMSA